MKLKIIADLILDISENENLAVFELRKSKNLPIHTIFGINPENSNLS